MGTIFPGGNPRGATRPGFYSASDLLHPVGVLRKIAQTVAVWSARSRERRALSHLDEDRLRDIGVNRYDAKREAEKPFWRD